MQIQHHCSATDSYLSQTYAPLVYVQPLSKIIHQLKYAGYFALAEPLGQLLVKGWPNWNDAPDLIIPIPLHARRQKERGFNQSALLARHLEAEIGITVDEQALCRIRHTIPQVGLDPEQRLQNVSGAFAAISDSVKDQHILLVDDVFTTGATMNAAASALLASGASTVSAYCLARTAS